MYIFSLSTLSIFLLQLEKAKKQFEDLQELRNQQGNVIKDKITLVQGQIDSYNAMLAKLQAGADNDARRKMVGEIESKLVTLQGQLQALSAQKDNPDIIESIPTTHSSPVRGGRGGGRFNTRGGRSFRGGGRFAPRGRGRGRFVSSRGRGRGGGRSFNVSWSAKSAATGEGAQSAPVSDGADSAASIVVPPPGSDIEGTE